MDINQELSIYHRAHGHKIALENRNLSHDEMFKELVMNNFLVEVMQEAENSVVEYANELESYIERLKSYMDILKSEHDKALTANKDLDKMFIDYVKTQDALKEITARHHKNIGMMEQKKSFASEGGKTRAANDKASKALQEVEVEIRKEINKFKRYGYGAEFAKKMWEKHQDIKDIGSITKLITKIKKELRSS